jgi:hypothetical protein
VPAAARRGDRDRQARGRGRAVPRARFDGVAYARHRHDTYGVCLTDRGVQVFDYRGATRTSTPGNVVTLYPDEPHDERAGDAAGFAYRIVYREPRRLADAVRTVRGRPSPLPFVRDPVSTNPAIARAIVRAFETTLTPLAADALLVEMAEGLISGAGARIPRRREDARRPLLRARGDHRAHTLRARAAVPAALRHEPAPLSADAPPRPRP